MESNGHDDSGEINRLFRFLTRTGPRFGLAIAISADRVLAAVAREQLREQARGAGLRVATLELHYDDERHDIVQMMVDASADADALFVVGLDRLVTDVFGRTRQTTAIANLNQRRDDLPQVLDVRVVFWVAKAAYPSLSDLAWDFCQVMLTTAELEATREQSGHEINRIDAIRVETPPEWLQLTRADEAPQLQRQQQNLVRLYETATTPRAAGDAAASVAELEIRLGHMASARTWFERAIACHERAEQFGEAGRLSRRRAEMALFAGELDDAQEHAERARELALRAGHELDAALARAIMAEIVGRRGDVEAAIAALDNEVLPILVRLGDAAAQAEVLSKIANFREVRGELDEALELRKEQIAPLQQQVADSRGEGSRGAGSRGVTRGGVPRGAQQANVDRIVDLHVRKGELDEAARVTLAAPGPSAGPSFANIAEAQGNFEAASEIREREDGEAEPPDLVSQARALDGRAARLRSEGELEQALRVRREQELPIYEQLGDTRAQTVVLGEIADLLTVIGRTDEAGRVLEEQMLPRADRLGDARLQARASSKALQLRRGRSSAPEVRQAESKPASAAPARKPAPAPASAPASVSAPVGRTEDAPVSPGGPMSVPASPPAALSTSTPDISVLPIAKPPVSTPAPEPEPSSKSWGGSSIPEEALAADDDEARPSDTLASGPKPVLSDIVTGQPNQSDQPTAEARIERPTSADARVTVRVALVLGIILLVAWVFWLNHERSVQERELGACTVVVLDPDDTRSLVRLQADESDVFDQAKVVCTPETQNVRVVVETASAAVHVFEWPPPAGLECSGTSACVQLYLGCSGALTCTEHGEFGCIAGSCREP
jgi:tetratricopeptide (TPR) repeat protein